MSRSIDYLTIKSDSNIFTGPKVISWLFLTERLFSNIVRCHRVRLGLPVKTRSGVRTCRVGEVERDLGTVYKAGKSRSTFQPHDLVDILDIHCDLVDWRTNPIPPAVFGWVDMKIGVEQASSLSLESWLT